MNVWLNYIIEANLALLLFLVVYKVLFTSETNFRLLRAIVLTGIVASLAFPLIHVDGLTSNTAVSIGDAVPAHWLPEVAVAKEQLSEAHSASFHFWQFAALFYAAGLFLSSLVVCLQLAQLLKIVRQSRTYRVQQLRIAESPENKPVFSFFNFIFIGNAHTLTPHEKTQIIAHESVHARQWHSFDVLLTNFLAIIFWFNPFLNNYRKIFVQLHEFEADARTVENDDVDKYCSLLARVALESAGYKLANHFNNSLTIKRIQMMRTIKNKIHPWRIAVMASFVALCFFVFSCHDQVESRHAENGIAYQVDEHAYPKGGLEHFYSELKKSIRYPASSRASQAYGKVLVQFVVNEDGTLTDLGVIQSPDKALAEEGIRVMSLSNEWIPAKRAGVAVKQQMVMPINFMLHGVDKTYKDDTKTNVVEPSLSEIVVVAYTK